MRTAFDPDGRTVLLDYKTAGSGVWPETAFQLAAYAHAEFYVAEDGTERPVPAIEHHAGDLAHTLVGAALVEGLGLAVAPERIYIEFKNLERSLFGWNAKTF